MTQTFNTDAPLLSTRELPPGNFYGRLCIARRGDKFWWTVENFDGFTWCEITGDLYDALLPFSVPYVTGAS